MRVVVWWSFFTAATAWAGSALSMMVIRFLFGAGEAGCFPNITKAFTTWLPKDERVRAQSVLWLSARWGGAVTPLLVVAVLSVVSSWRRAFELFGLVGIVWAVLFYRWFRDNPHEHPSVNDAEKKLLTGVDNLASRHAEVPWRVFFSSPSAWLLWIQYACLSYVWYFYITWFPTYLERTHGRSLGPVALAVLAGLPLFGGGFGSLISGFCAAPLARRIGGMGRARKLLAAGGFVAASVFFLASMHARDPILMPVLIALGGLSIDFVLPCAWGTCMDVGGRFAGTFSGTHEHDGQPGRLRRPDCDRLHPRPHRQLESRVLHLLGGLSGGSGLLAPARPRDSPRPRARAGRADGSGLTSDARRAGTRPASSRHIERPFTPSRSRRRASPCSRWPRSRRSCRS